MTTLSFDDANQLYRGAVIEVESKLAYVRDILARDGEPHKLAIRIFGESRNRLIDADPESVFAPTSPYRLGYVQHDATNALYLSRRPRRQYRVGWCENSVTNLHPESWLNVETANRIMRNLLGEYPTYEEARETSIKQGGSVAFDRQFAVSSSGKILEYKGTSIARIGKDGTPDFEGNGVGHLLELFKKSL